MTITGTTSSPSFGRKIARSSDGATGSRLTQTREILTILDLMNRRTTMIDRLQQLQQQYLSASIAVAKLEAAAFKAPEIGVVSALLEARASKDACHAELQKALWLVNPEIAAWVRSLPPLHAKWELPADPDLVAAIRFAAAEDDDAEACLDNAGSSEGDDFALLISGMDEALLKLSDGIVFESTQKIKDAFRELLVVRQALSEAA